MNAHEMEFEPEFDIDVELEDEPMFFADDADVVELVEAVAD